MTATKVLMYNNLSVVRVPVFFRPLRLLFASSSLTKIASQARAVVNDCKLAISDPGLFFCHLFLSNNFGGVLNGREKILCATLLLPPLVSISLKVLDIK